MKITVIGCGAMGGLYGGYLSQKNDVTVVDVDTKSIEAINQNGLTIVEPDGSSKVYHPKGVTTSEGMGPQDLVIVFVKALYSAAALEANKGLIGPNTYLLTLQNGGGHDALLAQYQDEKHVIIGTTQHNAARTGISEVKHGGSGKTVIGNAQLSQDELAGVVEAFTSCGLACKASADVARLIWNKLFTNVSASALTALFQMPLGYIAANSFAWELAEKLIRETCSVAAAAGYEFDAGEKIAEVRHVCEASPEGITSIQADIAAGRRTEVDTISGFVVKTAHELNVAAPNHEFVVAAIHALEGRNQK